MIGYRILNNLEELLLGVDGSNRKTVKELDHKTGESLERTWNSDSWADLDKNTFSRVNVNLEFSSFIDWRIEEGQETLAGLAGDISHHGIY